MTIARILRGVKIRAKRLIYNFLTVKKLKFPNSAPRVYYLGVTEHSNMGDMAQCYCIKEWIKNNYPDYEKIELRATTVVDRRFGILKKLKKMFRVNEDIIVFQSGYTTTDLGGVHDEMHKLICSNFPDAKILMMPQTIFYNSEALMKEASEEYSKARRMVFLARDRVSYKKAKEMFNDMYVEEFPDIVTTLIGKYDVNCEKSDVLFCIRNDSEKYFSDTQINDLISNLSSEYKVDVLDTTIKESFENIQKDIKKYIDKMIETFSQYKVIVTDRYHGTIFSLAANTPVIVIKTTDHKVKTGVEWFKGIYDNIYYAENLDEIAEKIHEYYQCGNVENQSYFYDKYYKNLKDKTEKVWNKEE